MKKKKKTIQKMRRKWNLVRSGGIKVIPGHNSHAGLQVLKLKTKKEVLRGHFRHEDSVSTSFSLVQAEKVV